MLTEVSLSSIEWAYCMLRFWFLYLDLDKLDLCLDLDKLDFDQLLKAKLKTDAQLFLLEFWYHTCLTKLSMTAWTIDQNVLIPWNHMFLWYFCLGITILNHSNMTLWIACLSLPIVEGTATLSNKIFSKTSPILGTFFPCEKTQLYQNKTSCANTSDEFLRHCWAKFDAWNLIHWYL